MLSYLIAVQVASPQSVMSSPGGPKPVKFDLSAGPPQVILSDCNKVFAAQLLQNNHRHQPHPQNHPPLHLDHCPDEDWNPGPKHCVSSAFSTQS